MSDGILELIESPQDLKGLAIEELTALAAEIRQRIIATVSKNGGHLASSLGAVELILALHYVFDAPRDRIIWDVGHQAYAHKLVTGRKSRFHTLRQKDGIGGFPRRDESLYDVFDVGHSSTSISAASGMAEARSLNKEDHSVIAVIGDGSMTAGLAFEGLNWAGDRGKRLIVVLNDNEMSISPNVGAMSSYLNRLMTGQQMTKLRARVIAFLKTIPGIGEQVIKATRHFEESLKGLFLPGIIFEEMGFMYVGPLEGHRLDHLIKNLRNVRGLDRPVLVHIVTKKGKGYRFAEEEPERFHGIGPFDIETGKGNNIAKTPSFTEVFGRTMVRLAREDRRIVAVTAAMCRGTGLDDFSSEFPDRFFDVGIAEQHGVTFAAAMATEGLRPVVAIYSTFLQRAYDQVLHDVCLQKLPVVFALDRGGFVGDDGPTHHGLFDFSYLRLMPNIVVMAPKDENELQHMIVTAAACGLPASIRYPRGNGLGVALDETPRILEIGKAELLRHGRDGAILAIGATVYPALDAAEILAREGIELIVINSRFLKPLDEELLCRVARKFKKLVTVEENVLMGGFGSAVLELFAKSGIRNVEVRTLGVDDVFVQQATQTELREMYGLDAAGIARSFRDLFYGGKRSAQAGI
ncbi:MAG: 1-deoxy-D-xylulose-5-phosphate synthase [Deltaproteobacteria bacterium]|nr:1-deoxy-D-xylulose-5-phosphate synthase [Deltaproteobacteria bacterium]